MADNVKNDQPEDMDNEAPVMIKKKRKLMSHRKRTSDEEEESSVQNADSSNNGNTPKTDSSLQPETDISTSVSDLLTLRKLKAAQRREGIDAEKLNSLASLEAKRRKKDKSAGTAGKGDRLRDAEDEELRKSKAQRLVKSYNFQHQSTALDVDKHMMAYIESELKKRKGEEIIDVEKEIRQLDPRDELYQVSEKYRVQKLASHKEDEGNVALSSAMLTGIPEVDLGIENRLKNIATTEQAKKEQVQKRHNERIRRREEGNDKVSDSQFFYRSSNFGDEDKSLRDMMSAHEEQAQKQPEQKGEKQDHEKHRQHQQSSTNKGRRKDVASDEATMERFKKRMNNQYNRR